METTSTASHIVQILRTISTLIVIILSELIYSMFGRPKKSIDGKVLLLTGAAQGIGKLIAEKASRLGARLVLVDINKEQNDSTAAELKRNGFDVRSYACDVSNEKQISELRAWVEREVGPVDILVNNAGIVNCRPILELGLSEIRRTFDVNTFSHFMMIREFLPSMKSRGEGHIVATCSVAGILGAANLTDYCASKFAVRGLMAALHDELRREGFGNKIKTTNVCPVAIDTTMFQATHSNVPSLIPILKPDTAASGLMEALLTEQLEVVIPKRVGILNNICGLFPLRAVRYLHQYCDYSVGAHVKNDSQRPKVA